MKKYQGAKKKSQKLAVKVENENGRNVKMRVITIFGDRTWCTFLRLSNEDNSVSRTSPPVLSYHCVLHYFLTMPVGFHFNLTVGLKSQVSGIKIVRHCSYKRSIFQVEWLIATLILFRAGVLVRVTLGIPSSNIRNNTWHRTYLYGPCKGAPARVIIAFLLL